MKITVHGVTVSESQCSAMLARMQAGPFKAGDIVQVAISAGVPNVPQNRNGLRRPSWDTPAYRAADNLIQRQRKANAIRTIKNGSAWEPVPSKASPVSSSSKEGAEDPILKGTTWVAVVAMPKLSSALATHENRVFIHPVAAFGRGRFKCLRGWKVVGWTNAPTKSPIGPHAILYERIDEPVESSFGEGFEIGKRYWGHGEAEKMLFCRSLPAALKAEIGPWL